jgi:choline dehydrogenase-like flavoprotein
MANVYHHSGLIRSRGWIDPISPCSHALVTRVTFEGKQATGVEVAYEGKVHRIGAQFEVVLSLGAIHTPKVLMLSGIGDKAELGRFGIPLVQHLPGVGQNFQDHPAFGCLGVSGAAGSS